MTGREEWCFFLGNCENCAGCSGCGGCGASLELTREEADVLEVLGQVAFLPVARRADGETPVCRELAAVPEALRGDVLLCLEKKGLISLDYDLPLRGFAYAGYAPYPVRGSMALTARGQQVLALLHMQGWTEDDV